MIAVWMDEVGGPEVLVARETPDPVPGPGEVLVDVAVASITFVETQVRGGRGPFPAAPPVIPGNGVGGVVRSVGPAGDPGLVGRRVVTTTGGSGGYASLVAVPADGLVAVPDGLGLDVATALLADGRTATLLARTVAARPGARVLVLAAAGGVGTLLVQMVGAAGAIVVGSAGGPDKLDVVRSLGAAEVVDHRVPGWAEAVEPVAVVLDGVGGPVGREAFERVAPGGRVLRYGMASGSFTEIGPEEAAARAVTLLETGRPTPAEMGALTASALAEAAAGRLRPVIGQRFPLARAADAHRAMESRRTIGKTLLEIRR
ncbi:zinc-binding dehydrogenase [Iamia sp. SCSIO 61187]|uniref:zinc-binding dehydrogenase n=1 Tax=Iamia sp. SCSIO 61187 TaxID=2722752 RepID=UPI001C6352CB|nr:zinc-binding dehydrogenase [Iamia sp. SCSIO 61187]QYG95123.1 zinc-binding dehydrogenase [Iamia sp. SCSIO 61187]